VRAAVATVFDGRASRLDTAPIIEWFERGGTLELTDTSSAEELLGRVGGINGLTRTAAAVSSPERGSAELQAAAADFVLEGLVALKKISRAEDGRLMVPANAERGRTRERERTIEQMMDEDDEPVKGKKKYYN